MVEKSLARIEKLVLERPRVVLTAAVLVALVSAWLGFNLEILFHYGRPREIAIVGDPTEPATKELIDEVYRHYLPNKVVALLRPSDSHADDELPLLKGKKLIDGKPAAYVCENFRCRLPVSSPQKLARELLEHDM